MKYPDENSLRLRAFRCLQVFRLPRRRASRGEDYVDPPWEVSCFNERVVSR
jgi:hypothetical protein